MVTIFTTAKDFTKEFSIIQRNALSSWRSLSDDLEIIIMGNSVGALEAANEFNAIFLPDVKVSSRNIPLVSGLFLDAKKIAKNDNLCYINCDIVLNDDILNAFLIIQKNFKRYLGVCYRFNIECNQEYNFNNSRDRDKFFQKANNSSEIDSSSAIDIFYFNRCLYKNIPDFEIGRFGWDNWLIWQARRTLTPVIDLTNHSKIFHQNHSYNHAGYKTQSEMINSQEIQKNKFLVGDKKLNLNDSNWVLSNGKIKKKKDYEFKQRNLGKIAVIFPEISFLLILYKRIYRRVEKLLGYSQRLHQRKKSRLLVKEEKLSAEIESFQDLWHGGFKTGYEAKRNQSEIEKFLVDKLKNKQVLEIGCGGGQWSKFLYKYVDHLYCTDVLSADHNQFWEYVGREKQDKIKYFHIKNFSLSEIQDNSIEFVFSYDVFCHISLSGQDEYLKNIYSKCKDKAELCIMYADANKYFQNEPENIHIQEKEQGIFDDHERLQRKLIEECDSNPYPGRWYWIGMKNFIHICEKYSYVIVNNDLDIDKSNPITLFKKQL